MIDMNLFFIILKRYDFFPEYLTKLLQCNFTYTFLLYKVIKYMRLLFCYYLFHDIFKDKIKIRFTVLVMVLYNVKIAIVALFNETFAGFWHIINKKENLN